MQYFKVNLSFSNFLYAALAFVFLTNSCTSRAQVTDEEPLILTEADTINSLKLLFIGDVMGHGPQIRAAYVDSTKTYNYEPVFQYVKPIVEEADLAIGNLEVTLSPKPPYAGYPRFRSPDALATALRLAGFDMMVTANNHSNDGGLSGVLHTIDTLKGLGFYQTGTFKSEEERESFYPLIVFKNDFKLAFLNYTYGTNGLSTKAPSVVNMIDTMQMETDMRLALQLKPDAIIVLMHWGLEYKLIESQEQRELTAKLFEWGADMVIGAHPHVVQPIKRKTLRVDSLNTRDVVVSYSLGNFISNQTKPNTDGGLIYEVELKKHKTNGDTWIGEDAYIPVWRYIHRKTGQKPVYHAVPVSAFEDHAETALEMPATDIAKMKAFAKKTREHLAKYGANERKLEINDIIPDFELPVDTIKTEKSDTIPSKQ